MTTYNLSKNVLFHGIDWFLGISNKLCKKQTIFKVFRGERRGWDNMFYPQTNHGIDRNFIKPVLLTGKSLNSLVAVPDGDAFCCNTIRHCGRLSPPAHCLYYLSYVTRYGVAYKSNTNDYLLSGVFAR